MTNVIKNRKQKPQILKNCTYQYLKLCFSKGIFSQKEKANRILGKIIYKAYLIKELIQNIYRTLIPQ